MPISSVTVDTFPRVPTFVHAVHASASTAGENFEDPSYGRLLTSAGSTPAFASLNPRSLPSEGSRAFYRPVNKFTQPSSAVINGVTVTALDVSCDTRTSIIVDCVIARPSGGRTGYRAVTVSGEIAHDNSGD